jgi:hypothetical protein
LDLLRGGAAVSGCRSRSRRRRAASTDSPTSLWCICTRNRVSRPHMTTPTCKRGSLVALTLTGSLPRFEGVFQRSVVPPPERAKSAWLLEGEAPAERDTLFWLFFARPKNRDRRERKKEHEAPARKNENAVALLKKKSPPDGDTPGKRSSYGQDSEPVNVSL